MSGRAAARKPLRNPSHIVLPKKGAPYLVVEQLPRQQEDLELALGRKFIAALSHFNGIQFVDLTRGSEPADLACRFPDGTAVELQIVEVVDQQLRELQHMRSTYRDALVETLGADLRRFSGCQVLLVDSGEPPYLPDVTSKKGRECLRLLALHIQDVGADIHTLQPEETRLQETRTRDPERDVAVVVERFEPSGESIPFAFDWTGAGPSYRRDVSRDLLPAAIRSKISKRYAKPESARFWLLTYSVDSLLGEGDPDIAESQRLLEALGHPFDEVWFLYPYADRELGMLVHVWGDDRDVPIPRRRLGELGGVQLQS